MKTYIKRVLSKGKKKSLTNIMSILFVLLIIIQADMSKGRHIAEIDDFNQVKQLGYNIDKNVFRAIDDDPQIYLESGEGGEFLEISFGVISSQNIPIQIYYANEQGRYSETLSQTFVLEKGEKVFKAELKSSKTANLRLDVGERGQEFIIESISIKRTGVENIPFEVLKICVIAYLLYMLLNMIRKYKYKVEPLITCVYEYIEKHFDVSFIILLAGIVLMSFAQYLLGNKYFLFYDIGSDSYYQSYPELLQYARHIAEGDIGSTWDFTRGFGEPAKAVIPTLYTWVAYFGEKNVAYLLGVSQIFKVFFAGFFFYKYLLCMKTEKHLAAVLSIGYAFCGHMIIRSSWMFYPNEVVLFAVWLFTFECLFEKKDYRWFPIGIFLLVFNFITAYYYVLYFCIFEAYILFRYLSEQRTSKRDIKEIILLSVCVIIMFILASGGRCFTDVFDSLQSSRFDNGVNEFSFRISISEVWQDHRTAFFRTIGNDIIGINTIDYSGRNNYLEDPTFYCGILSLIFAVLSIFNMEKTKRRYYIAAYIIAMVYITLSPFRTIANGLSNDTFKLSSLWIIVLILLTAAQGGIKGGEKKGARSFL